MILSNNQDLGEFDACREPAHIAKVWSAIEANLPRYWDAFVKREAAKAVGKAATQSGAALQAFASAIQQYERQAAKYRGFFDAEAMDEYSDDPSVFKQMMARKVPVISGTLSQRRQELQEWQRNFRTSRGRDLYQVFANVLDFQKDWAKGRSEASYAAYDSIDEIGLDPLDEDEKLSLEAVLD